MGNMHKLADVNHDYLFTRVSRVDSGAGVLQGRPYGGVAILWKNSLGGSTSIIKTGSNRLPAIKLSNVCLFYYSYCVYMLCGKQRVTVEHEEFTDTLNSLDQFMSADNYNAFIMCVDFNTSFQCYNLYTLTNIGYLYAVSQLKMCLGAYICSSK